MHALVETSTEAFQSSRDELVKESEEETKGWVMKGLKPIHRQMASLAAQGLKQVEIAALCGVTPQCVHIVLKQPLAQSYMYEMIATAGMQLEATFPLVVDTIQDTLRHGTEAGKLKAARLHLEATKRIGRTESPLRPVEDALESLERLASRLMNLQARAEGQRSGTFTQSGEEITDA